MSWPMYQKAQYSHQKVFKFIETPWSLLLVDIDGSFTAWFGRFVDYAQGRQHPQERIEFEFEQGEFVDIEAR